MNVTYPGCSLHDEFAILCNKYLTDKVAHHGYERYYPRFIQHYKDIENASMLEIGVYDGRSLNIWSDYFPKAYIYGIDIDAIEYETFNEKRHRILKADQGNESDLETICIKIDKPVFLIVDDGSHSPEHQVITFNMLFNKLLIPGGTYIIEDIETSYWTKSEIYGNEMHFGYHHEDSIVETFKLLVDDINREFLTIENRVKQSKSLKSRVSIETRLEIGSITFGKNCIIITKKTNEEKEYDKRHIYRFNINL